MHHPCRFACTSTESMLRTACSTCRKEKKGRHLLASICEKPSMIPGCPGAVQLPGLVISRSSWTRPLALRDRVLLLVGTPGNSFHSAHKMRAVQCSVLPAVLDVRRSWSHNTYNQDSCKVLQISAHLTTCLWSNIQLQVSVTDTSCLSCPLHAALAQHDWKKMQRKQQSLRTTHEQHGARVCCEQLTHFDAQHGSASKVLLDML